MSTRLRAAFIATGSGLMLLIGVAGAQDAQTPPKVTDQLQLGSFANDPSLTRAAPQFTPWRKVIALQHGWYVERTLVFLEGTTDVNIVNPDSCSLRNNGYILNENHTGRNLFNAMLLSAFLNGREVAMVISGCFDNRPQVISVAIH